MPTAAIPNGLNQFQELLQGTWSNQPLPNASNGEGGTGNPLSYNVMPLPQDPPDYILKNFTYYEVVKFDDKDDIALPATAPNRGGASLQVPTALFYEQQVYFADGPGKDNIVHVENGAWLNLVTGEKLVGPYPPPNIPPKTGSGIDLNDPNTQPPTITIAKQMSVPHGNSILALGSFSGPQDGAPSIPDAPSVLPTPAGLDTSLYTTKLDQQDNYQNPLTDYTANTNKPLQAAVELIKPNKYINWNVSTGNQGHTYHSFGTSLANRIVWILMFQLFLASHSLESASPTPGDRSERQTPTPSSRRCCPHEEICSGFHRS